MERTRKITVSGNGLNREYEINLKVDYTGCSEEKVYDWAFASNVITLQASFRKLTPAELVKLEQDGITVLATAIGTGKKGFGDPLVRAEKAFEKLSKEEKLAYLQKLAAQAGVEIAE